MNCSRLERKIVVFLQSWFVSYVNERTCLGVNWIDKMRLLLLLSPGITVEICQLLVVSCQSGPFSH